MAETARQPVPQPAPKIPAGLNWTLPRSGNLRSVAHDPATNHLYVEFTPNKNGRSVYRYSGVDAAQHHALVNAPLEQMGQHFHEHIKSKMRGMLVDGKPASVFAHPAEKVDHT